MQQPKSLAIMFLLGAFLTGGVLGFVADRAVRTPPYSRQFDKQEMRQEFFRALKLTATQRLVVDSLFEWRDDQAQAIRMRYKPAMDSLVDSGRVLMNAQLDTTQQRLFKELRDSMTVVDSVRRAREGKR